MAMATMRWGTWEELVLCGAVQRHGTRDWGAVASEVRPRTSSCGHLVSPQECEAKYEDLQERYFGSDLFEELRKRRVTELKRELEKSDDSIGSLHSKLESLKAEGHDLSSNDRSSAGSVTQDSQRVWSHQPQISCLISGQEKEKIGKYSYDMSRQEVGQTEFRTWGGCFRKRRGMRKRKPCDAVKEWSKAESDTLSCAGVDREETKEEWDQTSWLIHEDSCSGAHEQDDNSSFDLMGTLETILKNEGVSVFTNRIESQKSTRYKKMIRQHTDFGSIKTRMKDGSISSAKDLFRDLLLLSSNALIFFPKDSHEHKSALLLRELVMKELQKNIQWPNKRDDGGTPFSSIIPSCNPTVGETQSHAVKKTATEASSDATRGKFAKETAGSLPKKRGVGRPPKNKTASSLKGRKRAQRR